MPNERIFPAVSVQTAGGRILPSPNQFYLTGEDRLRVMSVNALAGVAIKIQFRTANFAGDTVPHSEDHTPASDRSLRREDFAIGSGSLLNVTVFCRAGAPQIGQTFVIVQLIRGSGAAAIVLGTILAGYITATQALGFPGSPILSSIDAGYAVRTINGTQPGFQAEINEVVPTGARWELLALSTLLTTDINAGNRQPVLMFIAPAGMIAISCTTGAVPTLSGMNISWSVGVPPLQPAGLNTIQAPMPTGIQLLAGQSFRTYTLNLLTADRYSAPVFTVREWLEVP